MTLQKRLLHAMLALLVLAAIAGVSTIFFEAREFFGRVAGTLVVAALAIAIAIPFSKKLGIQQERTHALIALLAIVIAFCLGLASIWLDFVTGISSWRLPLTTLAYIACVWPAGWFLAVTRRPAGRICGICGIAFCAVIFLLWMCGLWIATTSEEKFYQTAGTFAVALFPICACLYGHISDRRYWRWIGVGTGALAILMALAGIWFVTGGKPTNIIHCLIISAVLGGSNLLLQTSISGRQRWLSLATTFMLAVTGALGMLVNFIVDGNSNIGFDDFTFRLLCASTIVTTCGVLAIVVIKAFQKKFIVTEARSISDIKHINLTCPHCAKKQDAGLDESRCTGCGLIFLLKVAEPHCTKCNYVLLDLRSSRCPECGEPIQNTAPATA